MRISGQEDKKMHFKMHCLVYKQAKRAFLITLCYIVLFL